MFGKKKGTVKQMSIVTIDNYNSRYYKLQNDKLVPLKRISFKNNLYFTTFIANKDMIIAPVELSSSIAEEDIYGALEDKAYDELGLDAATEYIIHYKEVSATEGQGRMFQLFIIEQEKYNERFSNLRNDIKYIDLILPAPLLYQSLYDNGIVESKKVHCYLYIGSYDATITFYRNGEYLYSKSISYSLKQLYDRYCEISGKAVDEKQFLRVFQKEGVKTTQMEYQQNFIKLFNEVFITINDIVIYTKRAYKIEVIDQFFIGSEMGPISGVDEYAQNYLGLYSTSMSFDFRIKSDEWHIDHLHHMMALSAKKYLDDPEALVNFTQNPRPPAFFKRPSGQFMLTTVFAILAAIAYPLYFLIYAYMNDIQIYQLKVKEKPLGAEVKKYKSIISAKTKELKELTQQTENLKKTYNEKEMTLRSVYDKKVNYQLKSNQLAAFSEDMAKFNVHAGEIKSQGNTYLMALIAEKDKDITELIKHVTEKYLKDIVRIDIERIARDENSSFYQGVLQVELSGKVESK